MLKPLKFLKKSPLTNAIKGSKILSDHITRDELRRKLMNKKVKSLLLALPLICSLGLTACGGTSETSSVNTDSAIGYDGSSSNSSSSSEDASDEESSSSAIGYDGSSSSEGSSDSSASADSSDTEDSDYWENPGDYLGGGGVSDYTPTATTSTLATEAINQVGTVAAGETSIPADATEITGKYTIADNGNYYISSTFEKKISVTASGATLYLAGANISNEKKVIETDAGCDLTITVVDGTTNYISNYNTEGSNAIDCGGTLTINGGGYLSVTATKNGIVGESILIRDVTLDVTSDKDAIHAEIDYDSETTAPGFDSADGGYVYINDAGLGLTSVGDGIQADTFVYICNGSKLGIETNGGAPATITETSSDSGDGKGIKAGPMDWGDDSSTDTSLYGEIDTDDYLIYIADDCTLDVNSNDDAIHTDGTMIIEGGTYSVTAGDDAFHADALLQISGDSTSITIENCYEGIESAKVEISGGYIDVTAVDDGVNAADGTTNAVNVANNNCQLIISGGILAVDAEGDALDSNGSLLIEGGQVYVSGSTSNDNAALDADGSIIVNGGYLFACGALGMVETPATNSGQYCVSYARSSAVSASTVLYLTDSDANAIFYYNVPKACQSIILSCPELEYGETYCIYGGDTKLTSFTISSTITTVGSSTNIGNPGGGPGGNNGGGGGGGIGRP